ncbi:hypothetical protein RI367_005966 [Sorochytrium milnesiophthora]
MSSLSSSSSSATSSVAQEDDFFLVRASDVDSCRFSSSDSASSNGAEERAPPQLPESEQADSSSSVLLLLPAAPSPPSGSLTLSSAACSSVPAAAVSEPLPLVDSTDAVHRCLQVVDDPPVNATLSPGEQSHHVGDGGDKDDTTQQQVMMMQSVQDWINHVAPVAPTVVGEDGGDHQKDTNDDDTCSEHSDMCELLQSMLPLSSMPSSLLTASVTGPLLPEGASQQGYELDEYVKVLSAQPDTVPVKSDNTPMVVSAAVVLPAVPPATELRYRRRAPTPDGEVEVDHDDDGPRRLAITWRQLIGVIALWLSMVAATAALFTFRVHRQRQAAAKKAVVAVGFPAHTLQLYGYTKPQCKATRVVAAEKRVTTTPNALMLVKPVQPPALKPQRYEAWKHQLKRIVEAIQPPKPKDRATPPPPPPPPQSRVRVNDDAMPKERQSSTYSYQYRRAKPRNEPAFERALVAYVDAIELILGHLMRYSDQLRSHPTVVHLTETVSAHLAQLHDYISTHPLVVEFGAAAAVQARCMERKVKRMAAVAAEVLEPHVRPHIKAAAEWIDKWAPVVHERVQQSPTVQRVAQHVRAAIRKRAPRQTPPTGSAKPRAKDDGAQKGSSPGSQRWSDKIKDRAHQSWQYLVEQRQRCAHRRSATVCDDAAKKEGGQQPKCKAAPHKHHQQRKAKKQQQQQRRTAREARH